MGREVPIYIVTGTTGSIGAVIAETLAAEGKPAVLACRNMDRAKAQCERLKAVTGNEDIWCCRLDLDSFESVEAFCEEIRKMNRKVAALVNNAGVMSRRSTVTSNGYEQDYQVNTFSTALLTMNIVPLMIEGASVVFTTSVTRNVWNLSESFPVDRNFGQLATYGRSKRAITMFAVWLAKKLVPRRIRVNCADPGVVDTGMITMQRWFDPLANIFFRPFISSPEKGASSALNALKSELTGMVFHHGRVLKPSATIEEDSDRIADKIAEIIKTGV